MDVTNLTMLLLCLGEIQRESSASLRKGRREKLHSTFAPRPLFSSNGAWKNKLCDWLTGMLGCNSIGKKIITKIITKKLYIKKLQQKNQIGLSWWFSRRFFFNWIGPQIYLIITWMNIMVLWSYGVNQFSKFCTTWQHFFHDALFWIVSKPKTSYQSLLRPQLFAFWVSFNQELI